ncbi:MAG: hypothetical protein M3N68_06500, partial [Actinomycetota bacterium]|nr:hypothetical protein [Actinomycetota bacterium]
AMGAAAAADRRGVAPASLVLAGAAAVLGATATGWALATEAGTITFLLLVAPVAAMATGISRSAAFRQGLATVSAAAVMAESAAVAVSAGAATAETGVVITLAGGGVLAAGALWRHGRAEGVAVEAAGSAGLVVGTAIATTEEPWLALALTVAVPWLMIASTQPGHRAYAWVAASVAVAATWAWLVVAEVTLLEAYTLPAAAVALTAGAVARRRVARLSSWPSFGPGLSVALLPSLGLVLARGGLVRPVALSAAALLVVLAGARARLQAPLVIGGTVLLAVALDALWPVVTQVPRWATLGVTGLLLLWLGATAEHRMAQVRDVARRFRHLENRVTPRSERRRGQHHQ